MKRQLLSLFACLLFAASVFSQTEEEHVKQIRKHYAGVEAKLSSCDKVIMDDWVDEQDYAGYTPETIGYYDKAAKKFIKITEEGGGDWHEVMHSFYLKDGVLFFVFSKGYFPGKMFTAEEMGMNEEEYHISGGKAKTIDAFELRGYIANGKIVRYLTKKKEFDGEVNEFDMSGVENADGDRNEIKVEGLVDHIEKVLKQLEIRYTGAE